VGSHHSSSSPWMSCTSVLKELLSALGNAAASKRIELPLHALTLTASRTPRMSRFFPLDQVPIASLTFSQGRNLLKSLPLSQSHKFLQVPCMYECAGLSDATLPSRSACPWQQHFYFSNEFDCNACIDIIPLRFHVIPSTN
jgi:hypothetical protein